MANHITEIKQIGFVTRDIERAIRNFTAIGLTDWSPIQDVMPDEYEGMVCDGQPQEYAMRVATNFELDIEVELIQPLDDHSDYAHWLDKLDTWIAMHHIRVMTDNVDDLRNSGHELLVAGHSKGIPFGWEYYDFRDEIGTVLEYVPLPVKEG